MHIYISTTEVSAAQHAAQLVKACADSLTGCTFSGMGDSILREAGVDTIIDTEGHAVMGFAEIIGHISFFRNALRDSVKHIVEKKPDAVVLVDSPGFHLALAAALKKKCPDIPVIYYIAPKAWAWNRRRVKRIRATVHTLLCVFPFEEEWFSNYGINAVYVGNPTFDVMPLADPLPVTEELGLGADERLVSIFPGSRRSEVSKSLPVFIETVNRLHELHPELRFALSVAPNITRDFLESVFPIPSHLSVVCGKSHSLLAASHLVLAKSGTTTLEAALLEKPMVVSYHTSFVSAMIARILVKIPHISLTNIIAQKEIVPELPQATSEQMVRAAVKLLEDDQAREEMIRDLRALRQQFGDTAAAEKAAGIIAEIVR